MKPPLSYVPALPAAIGMMAGIVLFRYSPYWVIPIIAAVIAFAAFFLKRQWLAFALIFTSLGWLISYADRPSAPPSILWGEKYQYSGEICNVRSTPAATRLTIIIDNAGSRQLDPFRCSILIPNPSIEFEPGDKVGFTARLIEPETETDLPDENSYNPKYYTDGISAQAYVAPDHISVISKHPSLRRTAMRCRAAVNDLIYRSPVSSHAAWFLSATLLGDDSYLDYELKEQFRATGVAHYLALSGFHIGIIALLASMLVFPLKIWCRAGRFRHLAVIALIWLYAFICGLSPSLVRAAVLISIFLLAKVLQRQSSPYNSLCVAAILILCFSPRQLFAPGFQLSFSAVLSILLFANPLNPFKKQGSWPFRLASFITVPLAATLGTCLITIFHFHRFPLIFLIPNIILAVLLPLLLSAGVILVISTYLGLRLTWIGATVNFIYDMTTSLCEYLSKLSHTEITGIFLPSLTTIAIAAAIVLFAVWLHYRRPAVIINAALALIVGMLAFLCRPSLPSAELYITRRPLHTDIIVRDHNQVLVITTADKREYRTISTGLSRRYADYLARRRCRDSLTVAAGDFTLPSIRRRGEYIIFGNKILRFATPDTHYDGIRPDYLIVTRSTGKKPFDAIKATSPDTVIITRDTPPIRASRLIDSCRTHSIPTLHLTETPFSLTMD